MNNLLSFIFQKRMTPLYHKATNLDYYRFVLFALKSIARSRHTPYRVSLYGKNLHLIDSLSFLVQYDEIFLKKIYAFNFAGDSPFIR